MEWYIIGLRYPSRNDLGRRGCRNFTASSKMRFLDCAATRGRLQGQHSADDLVQDTLLNGLAKAHLWQAGTDIRAWLFTIMHNQMLILYGNMRCANRGLSTSIRWRRRW